MTEPAPHRDQEYPSPIWIPPRACDHPRQAIQFTGHFPPENIELSVFAAHCLKCGSKWDHNSVDAPYTQLLEKIALGKFGVVSAKHPEISNAVEWQRQNRYSEMMSDAETMRRNNPPFDAGADSPSSE